MGDFGRSVSGPVIAQCDNTSAIALMMGNDMITQRAKRIDVIHHWCLDQVVRKEIAFKYCSTQLNREDGLTKAFPGPFFGVPDFSTAFILLLDPQGSVVFHLESV